MPAKNTKYSTPSDLGSLDLDRHHQIKLEPVDPRNPKPRRRVLDQRTVDRLLVQEKITHDQWSAAQKVWRLAYSAGFSGNLESHLKKLVRLDPGISDSYTSAWDAGKELADITRELKIALGEKKTKLLLAVIIEDMACTSAASHARLTPSRAVEYVSEGLDRLLKIILSRH